MTFLKGIIPDIYEYEIIHKNGERKWLNQRNALIRDDQGNPLAVEGVVSDFTDKNK
ncbi:MAG: PAS domain-containing protein [Bacteroidales bacterium]|nr:PAS domain-containing protein [Bacteroidales bacterium]